MADQEDLSTKDLSDLEKILKKIKELGYIVVPLADFNEPAEEERYN